MKCSKLLCPRGYATSTKLPGLATVGYVGFSSADVLVRTIAGSADVLTSTRAGYHRMRDFIRWNACSGWAGCERE
jgi:hypothetical protein